MADGATQVDPELQLLKFKRKAAFILEILKARSQKEDVEDFVNTVESLVPILNRLLLQIKFISKKEMTDIIVKLHKSLEDLESAVVKLEKSGRLMRFLTSNRLRKKLENLNSALHQEIENLVEFIIQLEARTEEQNNALDKSAQTKQMPILRTNQYGNLGKMLANKPGSPMIQRIPTVYNLKLNTSASKLSKSPPDQNASTPTTPTSKPEDTNNNNNELSFALGADGIGLTEDEKLELLRQASDLPVTEDDITQRYANFGQLFRDIKLDKDIFKDEWDMFFGVELSMVEWEKLIEFMKNQGLIIKTEEEQAILRYVLDNSHTGRVSKFKYTEFLKGFGPIRYALQNMKEIFREQWFYGYLSSRESELLLARQPVGTFLIRLSKSAPGSFAIAFTYAPQQVIHILVKSIQPDGYSILDQETNTERTFKSLFEVISFYHQVLKRPFVSTVPLQPWFQGDLTGEEAIELLTGAPVGSYVIRFSSQFGFFAATYADADGSVKHALVEHVIGNPTENTPNNEFFRIRGENIVFNTLEDLIKHYTGVLKQPLSNKDIENGFLEVKQIAIKTYDASLRQEIEQMEQQKKDQQKEKKPDVPVPTTEPTADDWNQASSELDNLLSAEKNRNNTINPAVVEQVAETVVGGGYIAKLHLNDKKSRVTYLFEDSLELGTQHKFPLYTTWIEQLSENFMGGLAFRIISPEKRIVVCAVDKVELAVFLPLVQSQILNLLKRSNLLLENSEDGRGRYGEFTFMNGNHYEGEWLNASFHGRGKLLDSGFTYEGEFSKGLRSGKGVIQYENGMRYDGNWLDNFRSGYGTQTWPQGSPLLRYEGNWKEDKKHGYGELFYADGSVIKCEWYNDDPLTFDRIVIISYSNSPFEKYVGEVTIQTQSQNQQIKFSKSGYGILVHSNGDKYYGSFSNDRYHGNGHFVSGFTELRGEFHDGKLQGSGSIIVCGKRNHIISGTLSASNLNSIDAVEIKQATFQFGNYSDSDVKSTIENGDRWVGLFNKVTSGKKTDLARALDDGLTLVVNGQQPTSAQAPDQVTMLTKILQSEVHILGIITKMFMNLFLPVHKRFSGSSQNIKNAFNAMTDDLHAFVNIMKHHIETQYFKNLPFQDDTVLQAISDAVFPTVSPLVLSLYNENYKNENLDLSHKLSKLAQYDVPEQLEMLGLNPKLYSKDDALPYGAAIDTLSDLFATTNTTPISKIKSLMNTINSIHAYIKPFMDPSKVGADDLLPCVCFVTARAVLQFPSERNIVAELKFIEDFLDDFHKHGMNGYIFTQFQIAVNYLKQTLVVKPKS